MNQKVKQLSQIAPAERILLLPHCLRRSNTCRATYNSEGLQCAGCNPGCPVNLLQTAALEYGYMGVCVAPGGHLALKYVKEKRPRAIVAIACEKELEEGVQGVKALTQVKFKPVMIIIPLLKNGCLDTEVDVEGALMIIRSGCLEFVGGISS